METMMVTGGAGFVGSNFVRMVLATTQYQVVVVDALVVTNFRENLGDSLGDPRMRFHQADIADTPAMRRILRESAPRWIVNCADVGQTESTTECTAAYIQNNVFGVFHLLEAVRAHFDTLSPLEKERFRFLHVSTDKVFGSLQSAGRFSEQSPCAATSAYSASKAAAEQFALACQARYGLPLIITNASKTYGPRQWPDQLIPRWLLDALGGRSIVMQGDNISDWLYVEDHCEGILGALHQGVPGQRYNLGGDAELKDSEVLDRIFEALEAEVPAASNAALKSKGIARYNDLKAKVKERQGQERRCAVISLKARKELGWRPRHRFDVALAKTTKWYVDQREWYESIRSAQLIETTRRTACETVSARQV